MNCQLLVKEDQIVVWIVSKKRKKKKRKFSYLEFSVIYIPVCVCWNCRRIFMFSIKHKCIFLIGCHDFWIIDGPISLKFYTHEEQITNSSITPVSATTFFFLIVWKSWNFSSWNRHGCHFDKIHSVYLIS